MSLSVEQYIVMRLNALLHTTDGAIVKRLEGGMSNYTYVVSAGGRTYTYRVPGKFAEYFVDRDNELDNIRMAEGLGLNSHTIYMEVLSGEKLADYVEGTIMSDTDVVSMNDLSVAALKRLHSSKLPMKPYDPFARLDSYEGYCRECGYRHPDEYKSMREQLDTMSTQIEKVPLVPCHCDYQPTNIVRSSDRLYVLDWEFAGLNDPIYDIACYGNAGIDKALSLLTSYLGRTPERGELQRLYFHRAFQCAQWYNVAIFKDLVGLSKDLNMDFSQIAVMFYNLAVGHIRQFNELRDA